MIGLLRWALVSCLGLACSEPVPKKHATGSAAVAAPPDTAPADAAPLAADAAPFAADAAPLAGGTTSPSSPPHAVDATLLLAPACAEGSTTPSMLAVSLSVPANHRTVFRLDDTVMGTAGMAALITDATARDDRGELAVVRRVRAGTLELSPSRPVRGTLTLRYLAHSVPATELGAREGLRHDDTGVGGHGRHFLVLPESSRRVQMRVAWGAPQCPPSTVGEGMSSFGGGDAPSELEGELSALREGAYFWGRPHQVALDDGSLHLRLAWFGEPKLAIEAASAWASRLLAAERAFFADDDPSPYRIFVRVLQSHTDRANGIAHETSMLSAIGPRTGFARRLKVNFAHEMLHRWLGMRLRLRTPEGTSYWFTEGFTVHYSNRIAFRAGLLSTDELLESLNDLATRHFDNKRARATNDEIRRSFYSDDALAIVPYTRGALYAAELDAALRAASGGKRTLDDVLRELYRDAVAKPGGLAANAVRRAIEAELGSSGVARYDAVIVRGDHPRPPSGAYGPCFAQQPRAQDAHQQVASPRDGFIWVRVSDVPDARCRTW